MQVRILLPRLMSGSPKARGEVTEAIVSAELLRRGYAVLEPKGDNLRYDLVVDTGEDLLKVQVKTANTKESKVVVHTSSTNYAEGLWEKNSYKSDVDWFIAYSYERDEFYEFPIDEAPETQLHIRFEEPENNHPNFNWYKDFLMTERFK